MSGSQVVDHLIRFLKAGIGVQQHLDNITQPTSCLGFHPKQHSCALVINNYTIPCMATCSVGVLDEPFNAHYAFETSYSSYLTNFTFLQTTVYNIDVKETNATPRVSENVVSIRSNNEVFCLQR
ncbi:hypothetical protein ILYODFUR_020942 [Ilyodon furcidens]|uniref:Uncharacterized protein n=1 Tax=Ilyodon furcidens TaxID=33524 RepID=A0ABV0TWC8_9TELE